MLYVYIFGGFFNALSFFLLLSNLFPLGLLAFLYSSSMFFHVSSACVRFGLRKKPLVCIKSLYRRKTNGPRKYRIHGEFLGKGVSASGLEHYQHGIRAFSFFIFFLLLQFYGFASRGPFEARFVYPPFLLLFLSFFYDVMRGEKKGLFLFFFYSFLFPPSFFLLPVSV